MQVAAGQLLVRALQQQLLADPVDQPLQQVVLLGPGLQVLRAHAIHPVVAAPRHLSSSRYNVASMQDMLGLEHSQLYHRFHDNKAAAHQADGRVILKQLLRKGMSSG